MASMTYPSPPQVGLIDRIGKLNQLMTEYAIRTHRVADKLDPGTSYPESGATEAKATAMSVDQVLRFLENNISDFGGALNRIETTVG